VNRLKFTDIKIKIKDQQGNLKLSLLASFIFIVFQLLILKQADSLPSIKTTISLALTNFILIYSLVLLFLSTLRKKKIAEKVIINQKEIEKLTFEKSIENKYYKSLVSDLIPHFRSFIILQSKFPKEVKPFLNKTVEKLKLAKSFSKTMNDDSSYIELSRVNLDHSIKQVEMIFREYCNNRRLELNCSISEKWIFSEEVNLLRLILIPLVDQCIDNAKPKTNLNIYSFRDSKLVNLIIEFEGKHLPTPSKTKSDNDTIEKIELAKIFNFCQMLGINIKIDPTHFYGTRFILKIKSASPQKPGSYQILKDDTFGPEYKIVPKDEYEKIDHRLPDYANTNSGSIANHLLDTNGFGTDIDLRQFIKTSRPRTLETSDKSPL
jgi:hypothetical protein